MGNSAFEIYIFLVLFFIVWMKYRKFIKNRILRKSQRLKAVHELNETYRRKLYLNLNSYDHLEYAMNSKAKYDRVSCDDYFQIYVEENLASLKRIVPQIEKNKRSMASYEKAIQKIYEEVPALFNRFRENKLFKKELLNAVRDYHVKIALTYTSPAQKNSYKKEQSYSLQQIAFMIEKVEKKQVKKSSRAMQIKKERALMTPSLRFEILERDQFTCQSCGSKADDGVKLHIDHIHPVSKGGKTVKDNLIVLCDRCNLGKSDKILKSV